MRHTKILLVVLLLTFFVGMISATNIIFPQNKTYSLVDTIDYISFTAYDTITSTCWFGNETYNSTPVVCGNGSISFSSNLDGLVSSLGVNHWYVYLNDSFGLLNYSEVYFGRVATGIITPYKLNYTLDIKLTSWPNQTSSMVYYNYTEEDGEEFGETGFRYRVYNSSKLNYCAIIMDVNGDCTNLSNDNCNGELVVMDFYDYDGLNGRYRFFNNSEVNNFTWIEGKHNFAVFCEDIQNNTNISLIQDFTAIDYKKKAPDIYLRWPNNNQVFNYDDYIYFNIPIYYNTSEILYCSEYIDNINTWLWNVSSSNWSYRSDSSTSIGNHIWSYSCTNIYGRTGYSINRTFFRLGTNSISDDFQIIFNQTNNDFSNISKFIITNNNVDAEIYFIDDINWSLRNLSRLVKISNGRIYIDSVNAPWLNKNATLKFYDLTFSHPKILKDGVVINIPFTYINGTMIFNVSSFSEYRIEETQEEKPKGGGGGGGGGGSICYTNWTCSNWSICDINNSQNRTCNKKLLSCIVRETKPNLNQMCSILSYNNKNLDIIKNNTLEDIEENKREQLSGWKWFFGILSIIVSIFILFKLISWVRNLRYHDSTIQYET